MGFLTPKHVKEGKLLIKGVNKFIHYKRDLLDEGKLAEIQREREAFQSLLKLGDKSAIEKKAKELQRVCERAVTMPSHSALRENVEVFFVAIVIALGIRAYFLQPFKIPTGSMQPTLNGIIGFPVADAAKWERVKPNLFTKGWDLLWHGRNYVNVTADQDFLIENIYQADRFKFFSFTVIKRRGLNGENLKDIKIWAPMREVMGDFKLGARLGLSGDYLEQESSSSPPRLSAGAKGFLAKHPVPRGALLIRGYIDTGDQVLVNKFSYHFRRPERGEVFVFTTKGIIGINRDQNAPSQHYIKRLCALPEESWRIEPPTFYVNGEVAQEPGIQRVMQRKGYSKPTNGGSTSGRLGPRQYLALGDNSYHSSDSRKWGPVPEENLVGPALFVYWPFAKHWGSIR